MRNLIYFFVFSLLFTFSSAAQETTLTSGGNASGSGGSASYSIGQIFYTLNTGSGGSVAQGIQQPYEISVISSIANPDSNKLSLSVYPVPADNFVKLQVNDHETQNMNFHLVDLSGKVLINKKISTSVTKIPMNQLAKGIYFLRVSEGGINLKTFKIIKN